MDKVKNVILDFGGVLINLMRCRCVNAFDQLGVSKVGIQLQTGFNRKDFLEQYELGNISTAEFRKGIRLSSGQDFSDDDIDKAWISMLGEVPPYKLELLLSLRKRFNLFLLSNTNELHWEWAEQNSFTYKGYKHAEEYFDKVYLSYKLHLQKPDIAIYEHVLADAGIRADETFFIDDSLVNCKAAETLGIRTYTPKSSENWSILFR